MWDARRAKGKRTGNAEVRQLDMRQFQFQTGEKALDTVDDRLDLLLCRLDGCGDGIFNVVPHRCRGIFYAVENIRDGGLHGGEHRGDLRFYTIDNIRHRGLDAVPGVDEEVLDARPDVHEESFNGSPRLLPRRAEPSEDGIQNTLHGFKNGGENGEDTLPQIREDILDRFPRRRPVSVKYGNEEVHDIQDMVKYCRKHRGYKRKSSLKNWS